MKRRGFIQVVVAAVAGVLGASAKTKGGLRTAKNSVPPAPAPGQVWERFNQDRNGVYETIYLESHWQPRPGYFSVGIFDDDGSAYWAVMWEDAIKQGRYLGHISEFRGRGR